jgi:hypothetical protein
VTVGWSHPFAVSASGAPVRVSTMSVNYQSHAEGGCDNTTAWASEEGWFQHPPCHPAGRRAARRACAVSPRPGRATRSWHGLPGPRLATVRAWPRSAPTPSSSTRSPTSCRGQQQR